MLFLHISGVASPETFGKEQERLGKDLPRPSMTSKQASSYTVNKARFKGFALRKQQFKTGFGDFCWDWDIGGAIKGFDGFVAGCFALFSHKILN